MARRPAARSNIPAKNVWYELAAASQALILGVGCTQYDSNHRSVWASDPDGIAGFLKGKPDTLALPDFIRMPTESDGL